jgi:hypothetical protein
MIREYAKTCQDKKISLVVSTASDQLRRLGSSGLMLEEQKAGGSNPPVTTSSSGLLAVMCWGSCEISLKIGFIPAIWHFFVRTV